jgi:hypothetical protein
MSKPTKSSLAVTHAELALQADGWDPKTVTSGSNLLKRWKCSSGHIWEVSPNSRTSKTITGCPYCSGKRPIKGQNDLASLHPLIANQADGWDPSEYLHKSNKKMAWKCDQNHLWSAAICDRVAGDGCPVCSNRIFAKGINDLETLYPEIASQADAWDPKLVIGGGKSKQGWICDLGHKWEASIAKRIAGQGCPVCSGQRVVEHFNSLSHLAPEIAAEAFNWNPSQVTLHSGKKLEWKCPIGHIYEATVDKRASGRNCPVCSGKLVVPGYNDLKTLHPSIALQAFGWEPNTVTSHSNFKKQWKCGHGHIWQASVSSRVRGNGCPVCANRTLLIGFNDLRSRFPDIANEASGWNPSEFVYGSHKKQNWKCKAGHEWVTSIVERTSGSGCPTCQNFVLLQGFNDLNTVAPLIAAQADGWDPRTVFSGTHEKMNWICNLGHRWKAAVNSRVSGRNCPICAGKVALPGFNDLRTTHPVIACEAFEWDPSTVTKGSDKKFKWECFAGHVWIASVSKRVSGKGCPSCATSGFNQLEDGWLYFIHNDEINFYQIGITNNPSNRLSRHARTGWEIIEVRGPMDGYLTQQLETASLHALEKRGAILGHKAGINKFDGYSEAWTKASLNVTSIKQILDWVYEDESK